ERNQLLLNHLQANQRLDFVWQSVKLPPRRDSAGQEKYTTETHKWKPFYYLNFCRPIPVGRSGPSQRMDLRHETMPLDHRCSRSADEVSSTRVEMVHTCPDGS